MLLQESWESSCFGLVRWVPPVLRGACLVQWIYIVPIWAEPWVAGTTSRRGSSLTFWWFALIGPLGEMVGSDHLWQVWVCKKVHVASWHLVAIFLGEVVVQMLIRTPRRCSSHRVSIDVPCWFLSLRKGKGLSLTPILCQFQRGFDPAANHVSHLKGKSWCPKSRCGAPESAAQGITQSQLPRASPGD